MAKQSMQIKCVQCDVCVCESDVCVCDVCVLLKHYMQKINKCIIVQVL